MKCDTTRAATCRSTGCLSTGMSKGSSTSVRNARAPVPGGSARMTAKKAAIVGLAGATCEDQMRVARKRVTKLRPAAFFRADRTQLCFFMDVIGVLVSQLAASLTVNCARLRGWRSFVSLACGSRYLKSITTGRPASGSARTKVVALSKPSSSGVKVTSFQRGRFVPRL